MAYTFQFGAGASAPNALDPARRAHASARRARVLRFVTRLVSFMVGPLPEVLHQLLELTGTGAQGLEGDFDQWRVVRIVDFVHVRGGLIQIQQSGRDDTSLLMLLQVLIDARAVAGVISFQIGRASCRERV